VVERLAETWRSSSARDPSIGKEAAEVANPAHVARVVVEDIRGSCNIVPQDSTSGKKLYQ